MLNLLPLNKVHNNLNSNQIISIHNTNLTLKWCYHIFGRELNGRKVESIINQTKIHATNYISYFFISLFKQNISPNYCSWSSSVTSGSMTLIVFNVVSVMCDRFELISVNRSFNNVYYLSLSMFYFFMKKLYFCIK